MASRSVLLTILSGVLWAGCGSDGATTCCVIALPTPDPRLVTAGVHTGPTEITFLAAEPAPGSTLTGCHADASGCDGRIRMRFELRNPTGGTALDVIGFLHTASQLACWRGTTGPLQLRAGVSEVLIVYDRREPACTAPAEIRNMKLVVEGTVEVASRQEWAIRYDLRP